MMEFARLFIVLLHLHSVLLYNFRSSVVIVVVTGIVRGEVWVLRDEQAGQISKNVLIVV